MSAQMSQQEARALARIDKGAVGAGAPTVGVAAASTSNMSAMEAGGDNPPLQHHYVVASYGSQFTG